MKFAPLRKNYGVAAFALRYAAGEDWARLDSNQGPRDYESPALPLSYRPILPRLSYAVIYRQDSNFYNQTLPTPKFGHRNCVNLRESANGPISRSIALYIIRSSPRICGRIAQ